MRLHVDQRHERVLALVRARGSVRVAELATELGVSAVTLRRDVETLAAQGRVHRLHGTVVWPGDREETQLEEAREAREAREAQQRSPAPRRPDAEGLVLGMVVPTTGYYYADVVQGAREAAEAHGARLVVGLSHYLPDEDAPQVKRLLSTGANGLLLTPSWERSAPEPGTGEWVAELDVPTVLVERWAPLGHPAAALDRVRTDHAYGAARAVEHLAGLGHRKVAIAAQENPHRGRLQAGYEAAVEALGLEPAPVSPLDGKPAVSRAERFDRTLDYLCEAVERHGVTAALVHSDADAIVLIPRLQARGVRVPEDLAVIAYDDEVAPLADVPLTAVAPAKREVGARAAELLIARLTGRAGARQHIDVLPELKVRS
ncbi:substrate-binding domain-containing protein [Streptomyces cavernicola]|uniref:Substrate-binding domain-containing protein n=1 Tax=Streptomyces cavernicola TaxID=3043613 RepID=A0ABT6SDG8_9ACTN|nr:substrate-binding domain-containing protein [Streptomyces sp. B-S-A6]MDI3405326.1 substrate-binding domain-containing protein [Streptomyces sp. B-S-A6]